MTVIVTNIKINHGINLCSLLKALVVDTVAEESRTRRLSILDAFSYIGYAVGSKLGVRIKQVLSLVQKSVSQAMYRIFVGWPSSPATHLF